MQLRQRRRFEARKRKIDGQFSAEDSRSCRIGDARALCSAWKRKERFNFWGATRNAYRSERAKKSLTMQIRELLHLHATSVRPRHVRQSAQRYEYDFGRQSSLAARRTRASFAQFAERSAAERSNRDNANRNGEIPRINGERARERRREEEGEERQTANSE